MSKPAHVPTRPVDDRDDPDQALTELQAQAFERGVPGARVLRWPGASHYLFLTREADVVEEVARFVATLPMLGATTARAGSTVERRERDRGVVK